MYKKKADGRPRRVSQTAWWYREEYGVALIVQCHDANGTLLGTEHVDLTWTRERPREAGWYWWRENQLCTNQEHWTVLRIRQGHIDKLDVITIGTQVYFVQETPGEWAGPISMPEERV